MAARFLTLTVVAMAIIALSAIGWLLLTVPPSIPLALPTFYLLAFVALSSLASLAAWLFVRPTPRPGRFASPAGFLGHAMLLATVSLFATWLQSLRMLTLTVSILLIGLYVLLELALLFGTRGSVDLDIPARSDTLADGVR